jgi:hypothetical protein
MRFPCAVVAASRRRVRRSNDGQKINGLIDKAGNQAVYQGFVVELRGFEPLTPSMRTAGKPVTDGHSRC